MDSTGISWGTWDRAGEPLVLSEVSGYDAMVWWTGLANPSFNGNDRTLIGGYLDGGGNLFATGQDLGFSMCDIGSSYYSAAAEAWYQQYLHATYVGDDTDDLTLVGVASDPISDGMSLNISGGDGANNQEFPDEVDPIEPAKTFFYYNTNIDGAVRYDPGTYKTAYLAFGFEAISTPANRELLMQRVMDWFGVVPTTDVASDAGASRVAYMTQNAPNPFNPDTEIRFSLPVSGPVRLAVYNVEGRLVRTLEDGVRTAGVHTVHWDGMDGNGQAVASGMYLYRIDAGSLCETKKMVLLR